MTDASHVSPTYAGEPTQPCDDFPGCVSFDAHGLVPVVVQQEGTGEVLMVAWANHEALDLTLKTRTSWFWSRSRKELWNKGATSGNMQQVRRILVDCDADTLRRLRRRRIGGGGRKGRSRLPHGTPQLLLP